MPNVEDRKGVHKVLVRSSEGKRPLLYLCVLKQGKAIPLKAWTGPDISRKLRLLDFKTIGT
jgi:hypothetical protein